MLITLDRDQVEAILADWAKANIPLGPPIVHDNAKAHWSLDTLSQHQAVLKIETQMDLFKQKAEEPRPRRTRKAKVETEAHDTPKKSLSGPWDAESSHLTAATSDMSTGNLADTTVTAYADAPDETIADAAPWPHTT